MATIFTCGLKTDQNDVPKSPKIAFFYIFERHMLQYTFKINVNHPGKFVETLLNFWNFRTPQNILLASDWPQFSICGLKTDQNDVPKIAKNRVFLHFWRAHASWYLQNQCKLSWKVFREFFELFGILTLHRGLNLAIWTIEWPIWERKQREK